jgi:hypothetical protein
VIVGNLVVRADPSFGGGELNISGSEDFLSFLFHHSFICVCRDQTFG